ncbi:hypothetical protein KEJ40_01385 [Candidatus Bathyarchaeota archaeon]|nr:hypothetical protein [Candidatus Bathyarchaeota archaeon]
MAKGGGDASIRGCGSIRGSDATISIIDLSISISYKFSIELGSIPLFSTLTIV